MPGFFASKVSLFSQLVEIPFHTGCLKAVIEGLIWFFLTCWTTTGTISCICILQKILSQIFIVIFFKNFWDVTYTHFVYEKAEIENLRSHLVRERGDIQTFGLHVATSSHCPHSHPSSVWWTASAIKNSSPSKPSLVCDGFANHTIWLCTY